MLGWSQGGDCPPCSSTNGAYVPLGLPPLLDAVALYVLLWQSVGASATGAAGKFSWRGGDFPGGTHPLMAVITA